MDYLKAFVERHLSNALKVQMRPEQQRNIATTTNGNSNENYAERNKIRIRIRIRERKLNRVRGKRTDIGGAALKVKKFPITGRKVDDLASM